eukprot:COSAG02_NODE_14441_length_1272_cov_1.110827_1_plen_252_part_01
MEPPAGDLAAQLYVCLAGVRRESSPEERQRACEAAAECIEQRHVEVEEGGQAIRWEVVSHWAERCWEDDGGGGRHYLSVGRRKHLGQGVGAEHAELATRGLTPMHVLARHAGDVGLLRRALATGSAAALKRGCSWKPGAVYGNRRIRGILPIHLVCINNAVNVDVVQLMVNEGGADQLSAKDSNGLLPIHMLMGNGAVSVDLVQLLLREGGADQLSAKGSNGFLPIHMLMVNEAVSVDLVQLLLREGGADQL